MLVVLGLFVGAVLVVARDGAPQDVDRAGDQASLVRWMQRGALLPLALLTIFLLLVGMGEVVGGKLSGSGYLILAAPLVVLLRQVGRHPHRGGWALLSVGVLLSAYIWTIMPGGMAGKLEAVGETGGPFLLSGLLLRLAVEVAHSARSVRDQARWQAPAALAPDASRAVGGGAQPNMRYQLPLMLAKKVGNHVDHHWEHRHHTS